MPGQGFRTFSFHAADPAARETLAALRAERESFPAFASPAPLAGTSPEAAARRHLQLALASPSVSGLTAPTADGAQSEFRILGVDAVPLTGTTAVKFRQTFRKIPVYGSLVTVELDDRNELVALRSALGTPDGVDAIARGSAAEAVARAAADAGASPGKSRRRGSSTTTTTRTNGISPT